MRPWVETVLKVVVMGATMYSGIHRGQRRRAYGG